VRHPFRVIDAVEEDEKVCQSLSCHLLQHNIQSHPHPQSHPPTTTSTYNATARQGDSQHRTAAMCRVEYTFFTCGHTADHSVDCELAQAFGPFFNRSGCVNYSFDSTHSQTQCGNINGFYCAKTQNGTIIDKCRDVLHRMVPEYRDKNDEKNRVSAAWESYRKETLARKQPLDSLAGNPTYRNIDHQRQQLIIECNALENRRQYLNALITHAYRNRHLLAPEVYQPLWNGASFDFDASIFTPQMLDPIRRQIPNQFPTPSAPAVRSTANVMNQQQHPQEGMGLPPIAKIEMTASPVQQTKIKQQQMGSVTPKRQTLIKDERSPVVEGIVRGRTPEGETMEEKAIRYRDQLKAAAAVRTASAMAQQGYDTQQLGVSAGAKVGGLYYFMTTIDAKLTIDQGDDRSPYLLLTVAVRWRRLGKSIHRKRSTNHHLQRKPTSVAAQGRETPSQNTQRAQEATRISSSVPPSMAQTSLTRRGTLLQTDPTTRGPLRCKPKVAKAVKTGE
jgi:hypothetical protein